MNDTPPPTPQGPPSGPLEKGPQAPSEAPPAQAPSQAPPPAAKVVIEGTKTERELALERDLKAREMRVNELEDENRQLKTVPKPAAPAAPAKEQKGWLESWLDGED